MEDELATLLRRARGGDREALNALLARLRPRLELSARQFADPARADASVSDLVQDAGLIAWQNLATFEGGRTDAETERMFLAWLGQIVQRVGIDAYRAAHAQRRRPQQPLIPIDAGGGNSAARIDPAGADPTPSAHVRKTETHERVRAALRGLSDETSRQLLTLVFVEGHSLRGVAEQLGLTYDQVRHRYRKALDELERTLDSLAERD